MGRVFDLFYFGLHAAKGNVGFGYFVLLDDFKIVGALKIELKGTWSDIGVFGFGVYFFLISEDEGHLSLNFIIICSYFIVTII